VLDFLGGFGRKDLKTTLTSLRREIEFVCSTKGSKKKMNGQTIISMIGQLKRSSKQPSGKTGMYELFYSLAFSIIFLISVNL